MLDVVRLRVLVAVARTGSLTAAAKELHYSQPSVSHHLAKLEAETGAKLIQRVGRGIRLTEAGRLLGGRAPGVLRPLAHAGLELRLTETEPPDALRMLKAGYVDVAVIFRYDDTAPEADGIRLLHLMD